MIQVPPHTRAVSSPPFRGEPKQTCGKVRRVLNGASKFHGTSLKKSLLVGPDLLQNLVFVLLRFRQHYFAVSADIEGMFLQVGVLPEDQPSLRFLWREDPDVAFKLSQELITLLALGGFKLTKFISNVTKINKNLNPPQSAPQQENKKL